MVRRIPIPLGKEEEEEEEEERFLKASAKKCTRYQRRGEELGAQDFCLRGMERGYQTASRSSYYKLNMSDAAQSTRFTKKQLTTNHFT
jgi:hypothetical protein